MEKTALHHILYLRQVTIPFDPDNLPAKVSRYLPRNFIDLDVDIEGNNLVIMYSAREDSFMKDDWVNTCFYIAPYDSDIEVPPLAAFVANRKLHGNRVAVLCVQGERISNPNI